MKVELLSHGEYDHLFIPVICFMETTHLSVHRFNLLVVFLMSNKVLPNHFSAVGKNIDQSNRVFKTLKIYIWINFSLSKGDWLWKSTQLENYTKLLCKGIVKDYLN